MTILRSPEKNALLWLRLALAGMTLATMNSARAELVLEDELNEPSSVRVVQITGGQTASPAVTSNSSAAAEADVDVRQMSRGELLRRERLRTELRNEDVLSERLEELRLREESRLTKQLLGAHIEERPAPVEIAQASAVATTTSVGSIAQATTITDVSVEDSSESWYSKMKVSVTPRGGISGMLGNNGWNVVPRYTLGAAVGAQITDLVAVEVGYAFNEYGVQLGSSNPWVTMIQQSATGYYNPAFETYAYKQHVIDANVKVYVLNSSFKIRPYLLAGGGYARGNLNYDQRILDIMRARGFQMTTNNYDADSFLATLGAGAELQLGKNVSVGALFKYHAVLTARENGPLNSAAFGGYGAGPGYGYGAYGQGPGYGYAGGYAAAPDMDPNRTMASSSLARAGFFSIMGNVNITF